MWLSVFNDNDRVLLLGEGNFSFARALRKHNLDICITATCYEDDVISAKAEENVKWLIEHGVRVLFGVDATKILEHPELKADSIENRAFHKVSFNFPHVGGKMRLDLNRNLLKQFFLSCDEVVDAANHRIMVTLCNGQGGTAFDEPIRRWDDTWKIREMAAYADQLLVDVIPFPYEIFQGYEVTGYRGLDKEFHMKNALTHVFHAAAPFDCTDLVPNEIVTKEKLNDSQILGDNPKWLDFFKWENYNNLPIYEFDITFTIPEKFDEMDFFVVLYNKFGAVIKNVVFVRLYEFPESSRITRTYRITYDSSERPLYRERVVKIHREYVADLLEKMLGVVVTR